MAQYRCASRNRASRGSPIAPAWSEHDLRVAQLLDIEPLDYICIRCCRPRKTVGLALVPSRHSPAPAGTRTPTGWTSAPEGDWLGLVEGRGCIHDFGNSGSLVFKWATLGAPAARPGRLARRPSAPRTGPYAEYSWICRTHLD
jgi:hypothetical protein